MGEKGMTYANSLAFCRSSPIILVTGALTENSLIQSPVYVRLALYMHHRTVLIIYTKKRQMMG